MLTQSVLLCLEVLAKHFHKIMMKLKTSHETLRKEWSGMFLNSLIETITLSQTLSSLLQPPATRTPPSSSLVTSTSTLIPLGQLKADKAIVKYFNKKDLNAGVPEVTRCLGALYLYCATLCAALKNKVLPHLAVS
jgi:hypothetical protein